MTAPLVPADVDLRGMPFMPLDTGRLLDSDMFALSTGDEFKAAMALWCKAWQQVPAASLPNDERILAHLSGQLMRWKKVRDVALRGFVLCDDGRLYHPVIAEKALEAWHHRVVQRAKAGKRWGRDPELPGIPPGIPAGPADDPDPADAAASAAAMQGTGTVKGQGQKDKSSLSAGAGQNGRTHHAIRGTRMEERWGLPDDWREWAVKVSHWDSQRVVRESLRFRDHYLAVPGDKGVRRDWAATWRNWMRIALDREEQRR